MVTECLWMACICKWCRRNQISFTNIMTYYDGQVKITEANTQRLLNFTYRLEILATTWRLPNFEANIERSLWQMLHLHYAEREAYGIRYPQRSSSSFKHTQNVRHFLSTIFVLYLSLSCGKNDESGMCICHEIC